MNANTTISATFTPLSTGGNVDLDVYSLTNPPATARPGTRFEVGDKVQNRGTATAPASQMNYFFSRDTTRDSGDVALTGARTVVTLAPGAASKGSAHVTIPAGMTAGDYYLIACVDDAQLIAEANRLNNCRTSGMARVVP
jgi:subtilase family serine protease